MKRKKDTYTQTIKLTASTISALQTIVEEKKIGLHKDYAKDYSIEDLLPELIDEYIRSWEDKKAGEEFFRILDSKKK